mgnify:CR=1 FL=1
MHEWERGDRRPLEPVNPAVARDRAERLFELDRRGHLVWATTWRCAELRCGETSRGLHPGICDTHDLRMVIA